jgi:hypothetical protein
MSPGDIVFYRDESFGVHRFWQIKSVCLGGLGQEGLIELHSLTEKPGTDVDGKRHATTWVPEPFIRLMQVYTPDISRRAAA